MSLNVTYGVLEIPRKESGAPTASDGNPGVVPHYVLWQRAFAREGYSGYQAAGLIGVSESQYSKAFSPNYPDQNVVMKRLDPDYPGRCAEQVEIMRRINRAYASLVAEENGLEVGILHEEVVKCRKFIDALAGLMPWLGGR